MPASSIEPTHDANGGRAIVPAELSERGKNPGEMQGRTEQCDPSGGVIGQGVRIDSDHIQFRLFRHPSPESLGYDASEILRPLDLHGFESCCPGAFQPGFRILECNSGFNPEPLRDQ